MPLDAILKSYMPQLVPLEGHLTAAAFPLMKIFPAEFCLQRAKKEGWVNEQTLVVETSSGNLALGLAIVCKLLAHRLTIVSDYACDGFLRRRMEDMGATVEIVPAPLVVGGYQGARLQRLAEIRAETPDSWWLNQYDNSSNPAAYGQLAALLVKQLGTIDCLVGTVGSGGSVCGTTSYLRELFPEMITVGVDTFGSVLFGQPESPRTLRGLGNSILPKNLDHSLFDEIHWVSAAEAYTATRQLHRETSLFCGGTSGACWLVARSLAKRYPKARIVAIFPDDGYRYVDTIYNNDYLREHGLYLSSLPERPHEISSPLDAVSEWSRMSWGRRKLAEVVAPAFSEVV